MKYAVRKLIDEEKDIEISFPLYMARHRRYTYAKFTLKYWDHNPLLMECIEVVICEHGFSINPKIERTYFRISNNVLQPDFINFYTNYEHIVTKEEYLTHFDSTLELFAELINK
jgi:hypothetical protein